MASIVWTPPDTLMCWVNEVGGKGDFELSELANVAKELGCTLNQLVMAWCISNSDVTTVVAGPSSAR